MKYIYIFFILSSSLSIGAQQIEFFGGPNHNRFFDLQSANSIFHTDYEAGGNISFGLALNQITIDKTKINARLSFENFHGKLNLHYGNDLKSMTNANVEKSIISLALYPLNKTLFERLNLSLGLVLSRLFGEKYSGQEILETFNPNAPMIDEIDEKYSRYSTKFYLGYRALISYDIPINDTYFITPQYVFHFGQTLEFINFPITTKSIRQFVGIGIKKNLKGREKG